MASEPNTLQDAIIYFADADNCREYLMARRWPNGVICPTCGSDKVSFVVSRKVWQCKTRHPKAQFSIKVGTIFEDSPITLDKWLLAMWMLANCKNGVSSYEISRATRSQSEVHLVHASAHPSWRCRIPTLAESLAVKSKLMRPSSAARPATCTRTPRRGASLARAARTRPPSWESLERGGKVRAKVVRQSRARRHFKMKCARTWKLVARSTVTPARPTSGLSADYEHQVVDHAVDYVRRERTHERPGELLESCLKRGIGGTYVSVEPFHLFRYVDEQAFRFNNRKDMNDSDRFDLAVRQIVGKRLTWAEVTGKVGEKPEAIN